MFVFSIKPVKIVVSLLEYHRGEIKDSVVNKCLIEQNTEKPVVKILDILFVSDLSLAGGKNDY